MRVFLKCLPFFFAVVLVKAVSLSALEVKPPSEDLVHIDNLDKKISVDFVEANLKDVLKIFTQQTSVNFVIDGEVAEQLISLFLEKVTVRQALKSIAEANGLGFYPIEGTTVLRVSTSQMGMRDLRVTKIYRLSYARVKRLKLASGARIQRSGSLGSKGSEGGADDISIFSSGDTDATEGVINAVVAVLSEEGILSIDVRTNSLIVTDYPDRIKRIDKIIEELDKKTRQVLIKAEIVELQDTLNKVLGTAYGNPSEPKQLFSLAYRPPKVDGQVFPFNSNLLGLISKRINSEEGNADRLSETTFGQLTAGQFNFILRALKTSGKSKFLARPRVITLDNEPAVVDITSETAINEDTIIDEDTNQQTTTVERTTVGVTLRVTPQINEDDFVTMILQPSVTEVSPSRLFPDRAFDPSTRSVLTKIRIKQGDTISIAGLIQRDFSTFGSKIPILGDIPLLGTFFSRKSKEKAETDLIVFITPYILDDDALLYLQKRAEDEDDYSDLLKESQRAEKLVREKEEPHVAAERMKERMDQRSLSDKIAQYQAKVKEYPGDPEAHSNLGVAYAKVQKYDLAIEQFKRSIMLNPNSGAAYNNLGNLYRIKKQYDAAISSLRRAVELVPDHPYGFTTLGLCYEMKAMYDEARASYQQALKVAPNSPWTNTARERLAILDAKI